jgi:hypothetical protein
MQSQILYEICKKFVINQAKFGRLAGSPFAL